MKILEALKNIKHLSRKIEKNMERISKWCSFIDEDLGGNLPTYNTEDIRKLMQQNMDWVREKARLRHLLHKINALTQVEFMGRTYAIDELLCMQNMIIPQQKDQLGLLKRKEKGVYYGGNKDNKAKVILQYDPRKRDNDIAEIEEIELKLSDVLDSVNINVELVE